MGASEHSLLSRQVHNYDWTSFSSASTSLLKGPMEQVNEREEERPAVLKKQ
jgi:hypothetical protein